MIDFIGELSSFMRVRTKYRLLPVIVILAVFGAPHCPHHRQRDGALHLHSVLRPGGMHILG